MSEKSLNKIMLIGRVGKEPELRYYDEDKAICTFSLATNRVYTRDGVSEETTDWHNCVLFGKPAEALAEIVSKGARLYLEGLYQMRKYQDKEDKWHTTHEVVVRDWIVISKVTNESEEQTEEQDDECPF